MVEEQTPLVHMLMVSDEMNNLGGCSAVTRGHSEIMMMGKVYRDDLTGIELDSKLVQAAIKK